MASAVSFAFALTVLSSTRPGPPATAAAWVPPPPPPPPAATAAPGGDTSALESRVKALFEDQCTMCHSGGDPADPGSVDLSSPGAIVGQRAIEVEKLLVAPGKPTESYLLDKLINAPGMKGELMPQGMDPLTAEQIKLVSDWIKALPPDAGATTPDGDPADGDGDGPTAPPRRSPKPFHGTEQGVLPTTTTLGKRTLQYRIDHRFGRIGTERGAFGLDAGVVMSMGLQYGILDGWDVRLRRTNSRKGWEIGTKYVPVRQEDGMPVSFGVWAAANFYRDFDVANRYSGDFMGMVSRLWFQRWVTMLTLSYHVPTNRNTRVLVDRPDDGSSDPVLVKDTRGTLALGLASSVYLGKRKQWGIDLEWLLPIPDGAKPYNRFYYRGGDADPNGTRLGAWSIGGSYTTGKHFFQVFFTNNREIHLNLAAPGGQSKNPFATPGVDSKNPFYRFNFFLGFNLARNFTLGGRIDRAREKRKQKKAAQGGGE